MLRALTSISSFAKRNGATLRCQGLDHKYVNRFSRDPSLVSAVTQAAHTHKHWQARYPDLLTANESDAIVQVQDGLMNFYDENSVQPYVGLAAQGPWIVTTHGAVVYDTGGYGMLGLGHNHPALLQAMAEPQVMANIMTPNLNHRRFLDAIRSEVGHTRGSCPYESFICLNSGSESNTLAMRIMDVDNRRMTSDRQPNPGPHPGRESVLISLQGSFHGRTDRPAMVSDSSSQMYKKHLASYRENKPNNVLFVEPNNLDHLRATFEEAESKNLHVEALLMEPVMGEGNPGVPISREFYAEARRLTDEARSLLLIDSIQAGLRAQGTLSIMDYPGFQDLAPPDFETFSKAISGGHYPLSVLALGPRVPEIYVRGLYGNTMTTNPRALEVFCAVMNEMTTVTRENIREQGQYMLEKLQSLKNKHPDAVMGATGTGLLLALHFKPDDGWDVVSQHGIELLCRNRGLGVIHGGKNALRFTPHFDVTPLEVDMITEILDETIDEYRRLRAERPQVTERPLAQHLELQERLEDPKTFATHAQ